jgi:hypothetical protein
MRPLLFLLAAIALLLQVAPSRSTSTEGAYTTFGHGSDSCGDYVSALTAPPVLEPPRFPVPTTVLEALRFMSKVGMGVGVNPRASMSMVPRVQNYLDAKKKEFFDEASKNFHNYIEATRVQPPRQIIYENWLAGYLTAYNKYVGKMTNILEGTNIEEAMLWVGNYCRAHPTESFAGAAFALVTIRLGALTDYATATVPQPHPP